MAPELWPDDELTRLANRYCSDKGTTYNCAHGYTRVYQALLAPLREAPLRMLEIGLVHGQVQAERPQDIDQLACPSLRMWSDYLPRAEIHGLDIVDFTRFSNERARVWQADQGNRGELDAVAAKVGSKFDIIIDDGSHASHHQQISLAILFRHLADGGLYIVEDLHYQPAGLELPNITVTRDCLRGLPERRPGKRLAAPATRPTPSSTGMRASVSTTSGCTALIMASPSRPSAASPTTSTPSSVSSTRQMPRRTNC